MVDTRPCGEHSARIENLEQRADKIDLILEKVRNRLPVWATIAFTVATAVIGYLAAK